MCKKFVSQSQDVVVQLPEFFRHNLLRELPNRVTSGEGTSVDTNNADDFEITFRAAFVPFFFEHSRYSVTNHFKRIVGALHLIPLANVLKFLARGRFGFRVFQLSSGGTKQPCPVLVDRAEKSPSNQVEFSNFSFATLGLEQVKKAGNQRIGIPFSPGSGNRPFRGSV
jgi:hypothetical protein